LSADLVRKSLDMVIPKSMLNSQKGDQWEEQIVKSFEEQNLKELSVEEAQDQFLMLLASYELMFASYFIVSRRKHVSLRSGIR